MTKGMTYGTILFATLMMFLIGFSVIIALDSYTDKKRKKLFAVIVVLVFSFVMQNYIEYYLQQYVSAYKWRAFVSVYGYSVRPAILVLFAHILVENKKHLVAWCLVAFNAIMHAMSYLTHHVTWIDENNVFHSGSLHHLCTIISAILLAYLIVLVILKYKNKKSADKRGRFSLLMGFAYFCRRCRRYIMERR